MKQHNKLITKNILLSKYLTLLLEKNDKFEILSASELSIVCFRYIGSDNDNDKIINLLQKRGNYYISRTTIRNKIALRTCIVNLNTTKETIDELIQEIEKIIELIKNS